MLAATAAFAKSSYFRMKSSSDIIWKSYCFSSDMRSAVPGCEGVAVAILSVLCEVL